MRTIIPLPARQRVWCSLFLLTVACSDRGDNRVDAGSGMGDSSDLDGSPQDLADGSVRGGDGSTEGGPAGDGGLADAGELPPCLTVTAFGEVDIPVSNLTLSLTVSGQPLPQTLVGSAAEPVSLFLKALDTGVLHALQSFRYAGSSLQLEPLNPRLIAGEYAILYARGNVEIVDSVAASFIPASVVGDAFPRALKTLGNVDLKPGSNDLVVDIPVADLDVTITLSGKPLPPSLAVSAEDEIALYLRAQDTGGLHALSTFRYVGGSLLMGTANTRLLAGAYDVVYARGELTTNASGPAGPSIPASIAGDGFPRGWRVLGKVDLVEGNNQLNVDIPVADLDLTVTVGGQPLPASLAQSAPDETALYLRARDTGALHALKAWRYQGSSLSIGETNPRVIAGMYDVLYARGAFEATSSVASAFIPRSAMGDAFPRGLTLLRTVELKQGSNALDVDIPLSDLDLTVLVAGRPRPERLVQSADDETYLLLRAHETGAHHLLTSWRYENGDLVTQAVNARLVAGRYDLVYARGESEVAPGLGPVIPASRVGDAFPLGYRTLDTLVLKPGANAVTVDIPLSDLALTVTVAGSPLPPKLAVAASDETRLVLRARDTGAFHELQTIRYSGGNLTLSDANPRVVSGDYDVYYMRGPIASVPNAAGSAFAPSVEGDALPRGLRLLQTVTLEPGEHAIAIDIPTADIDLTVTVSGQERPSTLIASTGLTSLYLRARDTRALHTLQDWQYSAGSLSVAPTNPRVVAGIYDIIYARGEPQASGNVAAPYIPSSLVGDAFPRAYRVLATCQSVE